VSSASFEAARELILERIRDAAARAGRDPGGVEVIAITKTVAADRIREAIAAGFTTLGENRVQERAAKAAEIEPGPAWHLVGPLQSNKARRAVELFDVIETVDSLELAQRLDRIAGELNRGAGRPRRILLQVNVDDDTAKSGYQPAAMERDLAAILDLPHLSVEGFMTVGRLVESAAAARPTFVALRDLSERLRAGEPRLGPALSMGMSEDFEVAIEEGATHVRIGRAIFGPRPALG
jgi:pyridoxal phosphate enzyme (YggS family)